MFQSTFPRRERRLLWDGWKQFCGVSIHVPAKGTTDRARKRHYQKIVSIHVPAKGTTWQEKMSNTALQRFNPRSREGNDSAFLYEMSDPYLVSIHVPAKGTTQRGIG